MNQTTPFFFLIFENLLGLEAGTYENNGEEAERTGF